MVKKSSGNDLKDLNRCRLKKLKSQQSLIKARIQKMEAFEKSKARKQDLQRKILIGAHYWNEAESAGKLSELSALMRGVVGRANDKALFEEDKQD